MSQAEPQPKAAALAAHVTVSVSASLQGILRGAFAGRNFPEWDDLWAAICEYGSTHRVAELNDVDTQIEATWFVYYNGGVTAQFEDARGEH
jgi:hypothetical protein